MPEIKLIPCKCGSDKLEHFLNESYFHMYTIRCYGCEKEWDFPTQEMAFKQWNERGE